MSSYTSKKLKVALYKIQRAIRVDGKSYTFITPSVNEFGEPSSESEETMINGLWHTTNSFVQTSVSEASKIRSKQQPQLLCAYETVKGLSREAILQHNDKKYRITDINDVGNFGVIGDICLEEVQSG